MILLLDNYDSFTYNLYQIFIKHNYPIKVVRSDKITIKEIEEMNPNYIIISPGPGTPEDAGISVEAVKHFKGKIPILGICLGHQAILSAFGVPIVQASRIVHGKVEPINHTGTGLFRNITPRTGVTRYHSLAGKERDIPSCFTVTARCDDDEVMAVEHNEYRIAGMQFHPESIGTKEGEKMVMNFLHYRRENVPVKPILKDISEGKNLSYQQAYDMMDELTEGNLHDAQVAAMLTSLKIKGVQAEELAGFAGVLKKKAVMFPEPEAGEIRLDTCGTGGSEKKTFNVSTVVALIVAASGGNVVKHGNRAVTSKSGSADLLENLGVNIEMSIERSIDVYKNIGITFLYARKYHGAMRFAAPTRQALGFRTAFNLIGPLSNPAYVSHQIIGVFSPDYTERMAAALGILGVKRALVVSGVDGYDEISLTGATKVTELKDGWLKNYTITPEDFGLTPVQHKQLVGGTVEQNAAIATDILKGKLSAKSDLVAVNVAAALYISDKVTTLHEGYKEANEIIKSGKGWDKLMDFASLSNKLSLEKV